MICGKCGYESPNDSKFCQNCGAKLEESETTIKEEKIPVENTSSSQFSNETFNINNETKNQIPPVNNANFTQTNIPPNQPTQFNNMGNNKFNAIPPDNPKKNNTGVIAAIIICSVLIVALLIICIFQFISGNRKTKDIEALNETIEMLEESIYDQDDIDSEYDDVFMQLVDSNIGYASDNFHTNTGVIVLGEDDTAEFELTAFWPEGGSVYTDWYSGAADVEFADDSWDTTVTMTVEPWYKGVEVITFTNDVDEGEFKLLIIVTD